MRLNTSLSRVLLLLFAGLFYAAACSAASSSAESSGGSPRKYRIGYIEVGPFWSFAETVDQTKAALDRLGWLDRVEFPPDAHVSPGWGGSHATLEAAGEALMNRKDIDLILSAGTDATEAMLAVNNGRIPIIGFNASNPLESNLVISTTDSGVDNFTFFFEPDSYKRLFRLFHQAAGFSKLGLLYRPTSNGRVFASVKEARQIARERGFKIVEYTQISEAETEEECMAGLKWLVDQGMDAFYIPSSASFDYSLRSTQRLLNYLMENRIPTFAGDGTTGVRSGALMGFSNLNLWQEGSFLADMIVKVLEGAKPRSLPMIITTCPSLSLNLYTAERIGFRPTFDLLTSCDVLFRGVTPHAELLGDR